MTAILVLGLLATLPGDAAPAGAAYTRGLQKLEEQKYDEAVADLEEALRNEPLESPALRYRNEAGRHRHAYFPLYALGLARLQQANRETLPYVKRERLQAALAHFGKTAHAEGARRLPGIQKTLEDLEKAIAEAEANAVPPELTTLKAKVDRLCEAADFEGALAEIRNGTALLQRYPKVNADLLTQTRSRQAATVRNYDSILTSRLDSISRTDPTYEADVVLPLLKPARIPAEVVRDPAARFLWLREFCDVYEQHLESVKGAPGLEAAPLVLSAEAFETLARKALEIDLITGFRSSRNVAHSMRMARLREWATAADKADSDLPGSPAFKSSTARLLEACDASRVRTESDLAARSAAGTSIPEELKKYRDIELAYQKRQTDTVRGRILELTVAFERRVAAETQAAAAEARISAPEVLSHPEECRKTGQGLTAFESQAWFETLPAPHRARILFARAVTEGTASFLEAETVSRVGERCRADLLKAFALDPKVQERWIRSGRLSPRLVRLFEQIRKP